MASSSEVHGGLGGRGRHSKSKPAPSQHDPDWSPSRCMFGGLSSLQSKPKPKQLHLPLWGLPPSLSSASLSHSVAQCAPSVYPTYEFMCHLSRHSCVLQKTARGGVFVMHVSLQWFVWPGYLEGPEVCMSDSRLVQVTSQHHFCPCRVGESNPAEFSSVCPNQ